MPVEQVPELLPTRLDKSRAFWRFWGLFVDYGEPNRGIAGGGFKGLFVPQRQFSVGRVKPWKCPASPPVEVKEGCGQWGYP